MAAALSIVQLAVDGDAWTYRTAGQEAETVEDHSLNAD